MDVEQENIKLKGIVKKLKAYMWAASNKLHALNVESINTLPEFKAAARKIKVVESDLLEESQNAEN